MKKYTESICKKYVYIYIIQGLLPTVTAIPEIRDKCVIVQCLGSSNIDDRVRIPIRHKDSGSRSIEEPLANHAGTQPQSQEAPTFELPPALATEFIDPVDQQHVSQLHFQVATVLHLWSFVGRG